MKVGDLVRFGSTTPDNRTSVQKVVGTIVSTDGVGLCSMGVEVPYKMGRADVMWPDGRLIQKEVYASLEVINENQ